MASSSPPARATIRSASSTPRPANCEQTLKGHTDGVLSVEFSPDGKQLLSGSYDNTARLWDLATAAPLQTLKGHSWWVWAAEFSPDAQPHRHRQPGRQSDRVAEEQEQGARQRAIDDSSAQLHVARSGSTNKLTEFTGHDGAVYAAAFSPDGKLDRHRRLRQARDDLEPGRSRSRSTSRKLIDGEPKPKPNYLRLAGHDGPVRSVAFSPNGQLVASGSEDNAIRLWDVATGEVAQVLRGHGSAVRSVAFSPDGKFVLSGGQEKNDNQIRLWNLAGYQEVRVLHATVFAGHDDAVLSARFSPDGQQIVTASRDRTASLWDVATGERLRQVRRRSRVPRLERRVLPRWPPTGHRRGRQLGPHLGRRPRHAAAVLTPTGRLGTLAVSPDGDWLVTGSPGTDAKLWDSHSGTQFGAPLAGHAAEVSAAAFSPQGDTARQRRRPRPHPPLAARRAGRPAGRSTASSAATAARSPPCDSRPTASGSSPPAATTPAASGTSPPARKIARIVLKHPDWVSSLDLSADGTLALTTCDDGIARLWRLADAQVLQDDQVARQDCSARSSFAPDGRIGGGHRRTSIARSIAGICRPPDRCGCRLRASAKPLETLLDFKKLGGVVWAAMFARDGTHVLTIGGNDAALWNLDTRRPVDALQPARRGRLGRRLARWQAARHRQLGPLGQDLGRRHRPRDSQARRRPHRLHQLGRVLARRPRAAHRQRRRHGPAVGRRNRQADARSCSRGHTDRVLSARRSRRTARACSPSAATRPRGIWDRQTGQLQQTLAGHDWAVLCGQFSPDGRRVITGSQDNTAMIWDAATGAAARRARRPHGRRHVGRLLARRRAACSPAARTTPSNSGTPAPTASAARKSSRSPATAGSHLGHLLARRPPGPLLEPRRHRDHLARRRLARQPRAADRAEPIVRTGRARLPPSLVPSATASSAGASPSHVRCQQR